MLAGVGDALGEGSLSAFERMKDKVAALETQAEVSAAVAGKDGGLEAKFEALVGASAGVDAEARRMRLDKVMVSNMGR